jgi:glycosyltransferase involved in cell wall biosynthesis
MGWRAHLLEKAVGSIDRFIAPTAFVRDLFAEANLIAADRIIRIPHGIDITDVRPRIPDPPEGPLRVAYLGGISWQKGVHVLIDAVAQLEPADVSLQVYGDLTTFPEYGGQLTELAGGRPNITFAGRLSRDEVWGALARTDVLVVPSLWYETAALVIQEAFAAGVPVITSSLGALVERVRHGVDGLLTPPGDSSALAAILVSLSRDRAQLEGLRAQIRPVMTIDEHVDCVLTEYRRLANASGHR